MIVRRLQLHPFAGTADREYVFAPGLNVVLGPNEAGKTTLGKALRQVLFASTKLTQRQASHEVTPYLPLGGGDTIRVSLDFEKAGQTWKLTKRWAADNSAAELLPPDGGLITDAATVDARLAELLGLSQGTWEHVLFAHQSGVGSALERITEDSESTAVEDLNEVLRRAVFETDGVSLEALGEAINGRWDQAFGRWDRDLDRPEGNRGLENPWSRGAGGIVQAWYERERAQAALDEAEEYYRQLDAITARLNAAAADGEALKTWVDTNAAVATDAEKRAVLEGKLAQVATKEEDLRKISQAWPVAAAKAEELTAKAAALKQRAETLSAELKRAQAWEAAGRKRRALQQAEKIQAQIADASRSLAEAPKVELVQIETLESLDQQSLRLRARLEAAKLGVTFRAHRAIDIETRAGVEPAESRSPAAGDVVEFTAGARVSIRHGSGDWELEVRSGDIDVAAEEARHGEIAEQAAALLKTIGSANLAAARELQSAYRELAQRLRSLEKQRADLLGELSLDALRAEVESAAGEGEPKRPAAEIAGERGQTVAESDNTARQAAEQRARVEEWTRAHQSSEALLDQLVEYRGERKDLEKSIAGLRPLPEDMADTEAFLAEFRTKKQRLDERNRAHHDLLIEKATLEGRAPALEPAEAAEQLTHAAAAFDRARKEGEAIDRISRDFEDLRTEMDEGTLEPWLEHLTEVVSPLTAARYGAIDLAAGAFGRADEVSVPFDALSMGTRACLGLAVRLSMARWFLEGSDGFLVLDDPLVDLDPDRQRAAAVILQNFAKEKQVILLTCHPGHAEMLGGQLLEM